MKFVGTEASLREEAAKRDLDLRFDGRTLEVACVFLGNHDPEVIADKAQAAASGPGLRMAYGGLSRRRDGYTTTTFVNTDEAVDVVAMRAGTMEPRPARTEVTLVDPSVAGGLWREFHRALKGGG